MPASIKYTNTGQKLSIEVELPYKSFECFTLPENCLHCPNGYMHGCGRNSPFKPEDYEKRPDTCKLKLVNIEELIKRTLEKENKNV